MANSTFNTTLMVVVIFALLGLCRGGNLFMNKKYNKYGTNPYLAPVFGNGPRSAPKPTTLPEIEKPAQQPISSTPEQEASTENVNSIIQNEASPEPSITLLPQEINQNLPGESANTPKNLPETTVLPAEITNDVQQANPGFSYQNNNFYPAVVAPQQNPFASFPVPNYSNNPYLQGLLPGGGNQPQNNVNNLLPPPQNAVPLPPAAVSPQIPQNPAPLPQAPAGVPLPAPGANNNPYLQNLNPQNVQSNQPFPSIPVAAAQPPQITQSYPTPCTNLPGSTYQNAIPTSYQPQNLPASTVAAKHLRARCLKPRGQFPSDKCNYFINCWDHDVREQPCPPGLAFSSKGYCDFEGNVDCNGLPLVAVPVTSQPQWDVSNPQVGVSQGGFVPAQVPIATQPNDQQPAVSSTIPQSLPSQGIPNVALSAEPGQSNSVAVTIPAAFPEQNVPASSTFAPVPVTTVDPALKAKCLKPRGQFPTEICNRYINCWDGVVRMEECPKGMSFSEKGYCDFDFSVNCGNRTYDKMASIEPTENCPTPHGTFRDKFNCSQYYTCMFGEIVARYGCATGLSYNDMIGVCDYTENVDCTHAPLVFPPTENHVVMQEIKDGTTPSTAKCTPGSIYRLNPQCTSAVLCRYGFTEIVECPSGFAYDSVTDKCLLPHLAKC